MHTGISHPLVLDTFEHFFLWLYQLLLTLDTPTEPLQSNNHDFPLGLPTSTYVAIQLRLWKWSIRGFTSYVPITVPLGLSTVTGVGAQLILKID